MVAIVTVTQMIAMANVRCKVAMTTITRMVAMITIIQLVAMVTKVQTNSMVVHSQTSWPLLHIPLESVPPRICLDVCTRHPGSSKWWSPWSYNTGNCLESVGAIHSE